ncbi:MAG TPA: helix-turn-helix transcriptional regulator [Cyclobacteriaceae bacterium]|nr:helix-turn-helix transcriptional regulator [Cyclobacteriaceae bacterium]
MKTRKRNTKGDSSIAKGLDESFISPLLTGREREESERAFNDYRRKIESTKTQEDDTKFQLLQLKFLMEDYLRTDKYDENLNFGYFLRQYIKRLGKSNTEFANEISIKPTELSHLINSHRDPNPKILMRLEGHSNMIFPAIMWFKLISKEKALKFISNNHHLRKTEGSRIKKKLQFSL